MALLIIELFFFLFNHSLATFATSSTKRSLRTTSTCSRRISHRKSGTNSRSTWSGQPGSNQAHSASRSRWGKHPKWWEEQKRGKSSTQEVFQLSIYLFIHQSIYRFIYSSIYLFICLSIYLSIYLCICLSLSLSIYQSIYLSFFPVSRCAFYFAHLQPFSFIRPQWYRRLCQLPPRGKTGWRWEDQIPADARRTWV